MARSKDASQVPPCARRDSPFLVCPLSSEWPSPCPCRDLPGRSISRQTAHTNALHEQGFAATIHGNRLLQRDRPPYAGMPIRVELRTEPAPAPTRARTPACTQSRHGPQWRAVASPSPAVKMIFQDHARAAREPNCPTPHLLKELVVAQPHTRPEQNPYAPATPAQRPDRPAIVRVAEGFDVESSMTHALDPHAPRTLKPRQPTPHGPTDRRGAQAPYQNSSHISLQRQDR